MKEIINNKDVGLEPEKSPENGLAWISEKLEEIKIRLKKNKGDIMAISGFFFLNSPFVNYFLVHKLELGSEASSLLGIATIAEVLASFYLLGESGYGGDTRYRPQN